MNSKNKNTLRLVISTICIIFAFICGYLFALRQNFLGSTSSQKVYIDVKTKKDSISIQNTSENIYFRVNGNIIQSGSISLK